MPHRLLIVFVVALCCGSVRVAAQEAHPPQAADSGKPTHGIIRKAPPKSAEAAKPTTEPGKPGAEPVKLAPAAASTEAVAAAIAAAVRTMEEKKPEAPRPRSTRPPVRPAAPLRRYSVIWPSQRLEVHWAAPDDRVTLSWSAP